MQSCVPSNSKDQDIVQSGARRQILGTRPPLATGVQMYIRPLTTSRKSTVRLLPSRLPGGIKGAIKIHFSSEKLLEYLSRLRSYRARFSVFRISPAALPIRTARLESQSALPIQYLSG